MSSEELRLHFPQGNIDVAPVCFDAEWQWLNFLLSSNALNAVNASIVSASDNSKVWTTQVVQKCPIGENRMGSRTLLCLTGEIAGFIASNTTTHANRLQVYYHLPPEHFANHHGVLMRPLMAQPHSRDGFTQAKTIYDSRRQNWYPDAMVQLIKTLSLPIDEDIFRANIMSGS